MADVVSMLEVVIRGREEASRLLGGVHDFTHVLSLRNTSDSIAIPGFQRVSCKLQLNFDDLSTSAPWGRWLPPERHHVQAILRFGQSLRDGDKILIHCEQGISRSTASAFMILAQLFGPGNEDAAMDYVYKERPIARPNRLMVGYADSLLDRNGAMNDALVRARERRWKRSGTLFVPTSSD